MAESLACFIPLQQFDGIHAGRTIHIIGCGPSLWNWPLNSLMNRTCIFINTSIHYAEIIMDTSQSYYRVLCDQAAINDYFELTYYNKKLRQMPAVQTFMPYHTYEVLGYSHKHFMRGISLSLFRCTELDPFRCELKHENLYYPSLFSAMSLGLRMGAAHLKLIGVDYGAVDGVTHWDRQCNIEFTNEFCKHLLRRMCVQMLPACKKRNVKVSRWLTPDRKIELLHATEYHMRHVL